MMKMGETFWVQARDLLEPLVGRVVRMEVEGQPVTARIISVYREVPQAELKIVPDDTRE